MSDRFEEHYWREASHYRKFGDYPEALRATARWYVGLARLLSEHLPTTGRHLDAGCGHGAIVHMMAARGLDAYGVDASAWAIKEAKAFAPDLQDRFAVADIQTSVVIEGPFDLITSLEVVEHLEDPVSAISVMTRALAPGGTLIVSTPNPVNRIPRNDPTTSDPTHISLHPPDWWREAVETAGLEVVRDLTYYPVPVLWRASTAFARWIPLGRVIGPGYLLVARARSER
ncbi:MAG: class I SAM-dependent methyltransferase [Gaiellaceae bacterium]